MHSPLYELYIHHRLKVERECCVVTGKDPRGQNLSQFIPLAMWLLNNVPVRLNAVAWASTTSNRRSYYTCILRVLLSLRTSICIDLRTPGLVVTIKICHSSIVQLNTPPQHNAGLFPSDHWPHTVSDPYRPSLYYHWLWTTSGISLPRSGYKLYTHSQATTALVFAYLYII